MADMTNNVAAKRILLTGGTDGIGKRLAKRLACSGHDVVVTGRRAIAEGGQDFPQGINYIRCDHSDLGSSDLLLQSLANLEWNYLDHLVINAGTGFTGAPDQEAGETIKTTMQTNLVSPILLTNAAFGLLERSPARGRLTLIGSTAAKGAPGFASYAASKAGLHGFARALRVEWQGRVDVQILHPGPTATDMHKKAGLDTGSMGRFFIDPEFAAASVEQHMFKKRAGDAAIGFAARGGDRIKGLIGQSLLQRGAR